MGGALDPGIEVSMAVLFDNASYLDRRAIPALTRGGPARRGDAVQRRALASRLPRVPVGRAGRSLAATAGLVARPAPG